MVNQHTKFGTFWTDARVGLFHELLAKGLSGTQIAKTLGCTRRAVLGKAWRMGLSVGSPENGRQRMRKGGQMAARKQRAQRPRPEKIIIPVVPREDLPQPIARKSLIQLDDKDCRWPVGDPRKPGFGFCADIRVPGTSYCQNCLQRAYNEGVKLVIRAPKKEAEMV
jgi:GcrA cell cycle regulator